MYAVGVKAMDPKFRPFMVSVYPAVLARLDEDSSDMIGESNVNDSLLVPITADIVTATRIL
jgi:hypothetical protein